MKKIIFLFLFVSVVIKCHTYFSFFEENPAYIATRNYRSLDFPGSTFQLHLNNTLLQFGDFKIFEKGRMISDSEKRTLTSKNLDIDVTGKWHIINFGYNNWQFSYSLIGFAKGNLLEKEYARLVLYGNDKDAYATTNWQGAKGAVFSKTSLTYAYPSAISLSFLASERKNLESRVKNFIAELPIYIGGRINLYYPLVFAGLPLSEQEFGSSYLETYGSYRLRYEHTDKDSKGNFTMGLGVGFHTELPQGEFSLFIDDVFASVRYKNLQSEYFEGVYQDSLLHFQDGYEAVSETYSEKDRISTKKLKIHPAVSVGYEHYLKEDITVMVQYKKIAYDYMDGISIGLDYRFLEHIPLIFITGKEKNYYFEIKSGFVHEKFEIMAAATYYYGLFRHARGVGLKFGTKYLF